jgi:flagellar biosynthetic protein FlhB
MSEARTEEPTPRKLARLRALGQVARSRDFVAGVVWMCVAAFATLFGGGVVEQGLAMMRLVFSPASLATAPVSVLKACVDMATSATLPLLVVTAGVAATTGFVTIGPVWSTSAVAIKPERIDPVAGLRQLFSKRRSIELVLAVLKLVIVGAVAYHTLRSALHGVLGLVGRAPATLAAAMGDVVSTLALRVGVVMVGLGVLDILIQRWSFRVEQRMTKGELKREHREVEGDPHHKRERERLHREIVNHAVLEEVRRADVLIVNPTHFAVALRYDRDDGESAPEVLAKGQDGLAARMIQAAEEAGVPVMRDVPLAHALYELSVGDEIPAALYEAVAIVLHAAWTTELEEQDR